MAASRRIYSGGLLLSNGVHFINRRMKIANFTARNIPYGKAYMNAIRMMQKFYPVLKRRHSHRRLTIACHVYP